MLRLLYPQADGRRVRGWDVERNDRKYAFMFAHSYV